MIYADVENFEKTVREQYSDREELFTLMMDLGKYLKECISEFTTSVKAYFLSPQNMKQREKFVSETIQKLTVLDDTLTDFVVVKKEMSEKQQEKPSATLEKVSVTASGKSGFLDQIQNVKLKPATLRKPIRKYNEETTDSLTSALVMAMEKRRGKIEPKESFLILDSNDDLDWLK